MRKGAGRVETYGGEKTQGAETYSGESNWKLTARRESGGVTLLRCLTCDKRAALPDTLWGLPVTALGPRALSPDAPDIPGERVEITCGPGVGAWDNQALEELRLPSGLRVAGDYALYNCRALATLRLCDGVTRWGSGVLVNCRSLERVEIAQPGDDNGALAYFAGELNREIDIAVTRPVSQTVDGVTRPAPDGEMNTALRLIFPEYRELYEENCPAHHFDYAIEGAGYPYRHCFRERRLNLTEYDALWDKSQGMETLTACRLAWYRVRYPVELSDAAKRRYLTFLQARFRDAASWLLAERDAPGLAALLRLTSPDRAALADICALAREQSQTEALALLLDELRKRFPVRDASRFAL